jgi:FKBP-type peptidyl-prolyl cis-trans isomerase
MKKGGKRFIGIPPALAYGEKVMEHKCSFKCPLLL